MDHALKTVLGILGIAMFVAAIVWIGSMDQNSTETVTKIENQVTQTAQAETEEAPKEEKQRSSRDPGGIGMTFNSKIGLDIGNNLIIPFDGSGLQFGFGF